MPVGRALLARALLAAALAAAAPAFAATVEEEVAARIERLRAAPPPADRQAEQAWRGAVDEAWNYYGAHRAAALPVLRRALDAELRQRAPDPRLVLDLAFFLHGNGEAADRERAQRAFLGLDPAHPRLAASQAEVLRFAHALAAGGDARAVALAERHFLRREPGIVLPQMATLIDSTLACVLIHGAYGRDAEARLRALLADPALVHTVLEVLIWLGTPASNGAVNAAMAANPGYDTFARAATFLIRVGGPEGRRLLLAVDPARLDARAREYFAGIRPHVEAASFDTMSRQFGRDPAGARVAMGNSPKAILGSGQPRDRLIGELLAARQATLQSISDEALTRVKVINAVANTLRYRDR